MGYGLMRINDMGLYKVYRRMPDGKHEFRWRQTPRPLTERERQRKRLMEKPIEEMGVYLALVDLSGKYYSKPGEEEKALGWWMSREERIERKIKARALAASGMPIKEIAAALNLGRSTVYNYISSEWHDDEK